MNTETQALQKIEPMPSVMDEPRSPQALMRRATDVAGICREIVLKTACEIQGRKFVRVEGWESIATAHGCFAGAEDAERVYDNQGNHIGYKAKGVLRNSHGEIIATGEGYVGFDEKDRKGNPTWKNRAEYAGKAMAQTRAISRTCRGVFAHVVVLIDAGLSTTPAEEVPDGGFDDNVRAAKAKQANVPRNVPQSPATATGTAKPPGSEPGDRASKPAEELGTRANPMPREATELTRTWFLAEMRKCFNDQTLLQWACDDGPPYMLMPNQTLEEWKLEYVPTSRPALEAAIRKCSEFMGVEPTPQKPAGAPSAGPSAAPASGASQAKPAPTKANPEPAHHSEEWYQHKMSFGKDKGRMLGELDKKTLWGWWANYQVETHWNGKPKKPESIAADEHFREMLDRAGEFYQFEEPND